MIEGAIDGLHEPSAPVRVSSRGPFAVGSTLWRDAWGRLTCTVIAKATYALKPGESQPLDVPDPLQKEDAHWYGDPSRSVRLPSDFAPFKRSAEVVVVGSAFAEAPAASLIARVIVANLDKSVEAFPPRLHRPDGALEEGAPLLQFSLRHEQAAGGPGTDNPVGIDVSRVDARGRHPVPQLLPPSHALGAPGAHAPICCLGPIASTWPSRASLLTPEDRAWLHDPTASALPPGFPAGYFQAAPPDQWLDRSLAANERLVLEALNPDLVRLVMSLGGRAPRGVVAGPAPQTIQLAADLLVVDTEREICSLTYRGQIALDEGKGPLRVMVVDGPGARQHAAPVIRGLTARDADPDPWDVETTYVEGLAADAPAPAPAPRERSSQARPVLPFGGGPRPPQPSSPDAVLPFRTADSAPPPSELFVAPARDAAPAPPLPVQVPPPVPVSPSFSAPPLAQLSSFTPVEPPARPTWSGSPVAPVPMTSLASPAMTSLASSAMPSLASPALPPPPSRVSPLDLPAPTSPAPPAPARAALPSTSFGAAFGGLRASSDAAASTARAGVDTPRERGARLDAGTAPRHAPAATTSRQAVVSVLCFEATFVPRIRSARRFAAALAPKARGIRAKGLDEPRATEPPDERRDVLRVLSCGQPAEPAEIHGALADCLEDQDDLDPPLLLVAGELRPTFDEVEMLRAALAVAQQVAGGDKKILASIAVGQAALASPVGVRPETSLSLVKQIDQSVASLSLPQGYLLAEVERALIEGRKYKRRTLLGAPRVRADLTFARNGEVMTLYLPESAASSLPMLASFPAVAICEITPREDLAEPQDEALFAVALGRVLRSR